MIHRSTAAPARNTQGVLVIGCGYVGSRLLPLLANEHPLTTVVRSADHADELRRQGIHTLCVDLDQPLPAGALPPVRAIAYLAPPPGAGQDDPRLQRCLAALATPPEVFMYMSTTGVYGDAGGATVDESTPINPGTDRALRRANAERTVQAWCLAHGSRAVILRVPGIYGPGRLPLDRLHRGEPTLRREDAPIGNRIHVADLAAACALALVQPAAQGVYNICDGQALAPADFLDAVADLAGLARPPKLDIAQARQRMPAQRLSFLEEHRRIDARRARRELNWQPRYTDPREGIRASLQAG